MQRCYQVRWLTPVTPALKMMRLEDHRFKASEAKPGTPLFPTKGEILGLLAVAAANRRI